MSPTSQVIPHGTPDTLMTGAQALTLCLARHGVRQAFAYPGTTELHLCATIQRHPGMKLVSAWGDKEAAFMAAGANLLDPLTAVSILHGARGLTNALGAIADTRRSETAALHLIGMATRQSQPFLPPHAEPSLIQHAGRFAAGSFDCCDIDTWDVARFLDRIHGAIHATAQRPSGPVLLGIPQDLLDHPFIPGRDIPVCTSFPVPEPATPQQLSKLAETLAAATRPVIIIDDYLLRDTAASAPLGQFATAVGAPVFQVAYRRGPMLFERLDPGAVSTFAGFYDPANPGHRELVGNADLLITVEDRNMYPRVIGALPACPKIAITSNPAMTRKNGYLTEHDILVEDNPSGVLVRLGKTLTRRPAAHVQQPRLSAAHQPTACTSSRLLAATIGLAIQDLRPGAIVDDSQSFGGLLARHMPPVKVRIFASHGGFVGSGLPTAIGAAASGQRVVCLLGDHGFTNAVQALAAAVDLPITIIVCNNAGSVSLRSESSAHHNEAFDHSGGPAAYTSIGSAYGLAATTLTWPSCSDPAALHAAAAMLGRWLATAGGPALLELKTPERDPDFWTGTWSTHGHE